MSNYSNIATLIARNQPRTAIAIAWLKQPNITIPAIQQMLAAEGVRLTKVAIASCLHTFRRNFYFLAHEGYIDPAVAARIERAEDTPLQPSFPKSQPQRTIAPISSKPVSANISAANIGSESVAVTYQPSRPKRGLGNCSTAEQPKQRPKTASNPPTGADRPNVRAPAAPVSSQRAAILQALTQSQRPLGPNAIAGRTKMKSGAVRYLLHQMTRADQVKRLAHGKYRTVPVPLVTVD